MESGILNKKKRKDFLTTLVTVIKRDPTTSIKKPANELKNNEKTANK